MTDTPPHRSSLARALVVAVVLVLAGGCQEPGTCAETYSPLMKLWVGLPIPMLITAAIAALLILGIDSLLGRSRRRWRALLAVVVTCAEPAVLNCLSWPEGLAVILPASLIAVALLCLRDQGQDPSRQSWMHSLSGALEPSRRDRVFAGLLAALLVYVTLLGSGLANYCVIEAGQDCGGVDRIRE